MSAPPRRTSRGLRPAAGSPGPPQPRSRAAAEAAGCAPAGAAPEPRPAGVEAARVLAGRAAEAAVGVLRPLEPGHGAGGDGGLRARRGGRGGDEHGGGEHARGERRRGAPRDLEPLPVAGERAYQRGTEDEAEEHVADDVGGVEGERRHEERLELGEAVVARVGHPQVHVHHDTVGGAGERAGGRERAPAELPAGDAGEHGAADPDAAPRAHLPRRPRPLAEEDVGGERREGADSEAGRPPERVARQQHDVGRRLDVGQGRERDPPERRERRERRHEGQHARGRMRALVPREARDEGEPEDHEGGREPAHRATSVCSGAEGSVAGPAVRGAAAPSGAAAWMRAAPASGSRAPPARMRAVWVAKYHPPPRTSAVGASATGAPSPSSTVRSAQEAANSASWVATSTAAPAPASSRRWAARASLWPRSMPRVGSSRQTAAGGAPPG